MKSHQLRTYFTRKFLFSNLIALNAIFFMGLHMKSSSFNPDLRSVWSMKINAGKSPIPSINLKQSHTSHDTKNERHFHFSMSGAGDYIKDESLLMKSPGVREWAQKRAKGISRGACDYPSIHPRNESLMACTQDVKLPRLLNDWILFICFNPYNQQSSSASPERGLLYGI
jgi:hypothetical protein